MQSHAECYEAMRNLLHDDGFLIALVVSLALSIGIARFHSRKPLLRWGLESGAASAIAAIVGLLAADRHAMLSLIGLALLVVGELVGQRFHGWWRFVAAVPGAAVIAAALHAPVPDWAAVTCFVAIAVTVPCVVTSDRAAPRLLPVLLAMTALGMWATTPDTEHARVLVGAMLGASILVFDRRARPGAAGTAALVGLMLWASVIDGFPRQSAVVGAIAAFGCGAFLGLVRSRVASETSAFAVIIAVQAAIVVVASRVAGLRESVVAAVLISMGLWAAGAVMLLWLLPKEANSPD